MPKQAPAFTLVELIVVITILAILGTIAFISLQGYSQSARDSVRISDLSNINKGLEIMVLEAGKVPLPENKVDITASGTIISYQGYAGAIVLPKIKVYGGGKDPVNDNYYTYATNTSLSKYQLMGFLENGDEISLLSNQISADYSTRFPVVKGSQLGILLASGSLIPIQETGTGVDIVNTTNSYIVYLENNNIISGTGGILFTKIYNQNEKLLNDKNLAKYDKSLIGYWDMETIFSSGAIDYLKDFSMYGNNGICYNNSNIIVNCGSIGEGPQIVEGKKQGKATRFFTANELIDLGNNNILHNGSSMSISMWFKIYPGLTTYQYFLLRDNFQLRSHTESGNRIQNWWNIGGTWIPNGLYPLNEDLVFDKWYNLVVSYDKDLISDNLKMYINGDLISSSNKTGIITTPLTNLQIGKSSNELIDEVRMYNRGLSQNEIQALYNSMK